MYKPPENTNRVKSIKTRFENEAQRQLSRQLSDPSKRNIKRTPAFRIDLNSDKTAFQRNTQCNRSFYADKITALRASPPVSPKPPLTKSKSDFALIRSKFDPKALYTEPVPKALRQPPDIHHAQTLRVSEPPGLTDTLRAALKRPLPAGPAPRKPPRTFEHTPVKNSSFLHQKQQTDRKHDPRYMLSRLENALKNNKIKKQVKVETSTTSGEDSDDSVLFKSKSPPTPDKNNFNFNCLNGGCTATYDKIKESKSEFFVKSYDEPVYAEPFHFDEVRLKDKGAKKSLYYMSTSLICDEENCLNNNNMDEGVSGRDLTKEMCCENSSQSSFDSAVSTPQDETDTKIKHLINKFEPKNDTPNRIEELKISLQKTLDKCFDSDSEVRKVDSLTNKFETYVKTMPKYRTKLSKNERLFYCCLVVGWDREKPQTKFKFPAHAKVPDRIEDLCYPEAASGPLDITDNAQCYSLVITNDKGERTFGYCRRVIPEGSTKCIPLAYCILSKHRAPRFYKKILAELETRHGIPDRERDELISAFYFNKFPRPGESIKIDLSRFEGRSHDYENVNRMTELTLTLHHDTRYEEADLKPLHTLPTEILLRIFASLLLERKVVLISCVISKLSCCVDALQSILYPFSWPHTFIPILPQCLWDVVESPTPVICGILSVAIVNDHKIENGIVVDLDTGNIMSEEGDEDSILSDSMKKAWNQSIALANTVPKEDYVHSVYLSDAYIKVFIVSLKHYKNHIVGKNFEKEAFVRNGKTKGIRRFLKWFTETSMFVSFIDMVISNPDSFTLFDKKIEMYGSDESNVILTKLLEWKKH
ncbi:DENN domain-containing protein 2B isoform X2 [Tribolium castaneum]|uniref:UDENN domain-containing protein n=1 Tax=Tribolium castaneum TaxID=7070 RepID=A0A139WBW4_TRICA|nr:PREDICTED: suppression of tumorigenicity 5 protein isoform X2 [Tribolium castaneum]KYB25414.1 hypothetical protein TcasGA2_TC031252 [Tribolium castaneum]|eukprot:XP_972550.2 PREDICTED: suppression of tumorigenicity 5 protein isoform X2 [Tribolium castaneum]